jgi:hypothetical protein
MQQPLVDPSLCHDLLLIDQHYVTGTLLLHVMVMVDRKKKELMTSSLAKLIWGRFQLICPLQILSPFL